MHVRNGLEWTFDTEAERYDRMRPGYSGELYQDIFRCAPIGAGSRVLEVGIGSGQATTPFLKTGCCLTAVEYGAELAAVCRRKFGEFPNFSVVTGKFEDYVGEPSSLDLVYSATAFHWIPEEIGYRKVFDLLKSGGVFARFANHPSGDRGRKELWDSIQALYSVYMPGSRSPREFGEDQAADIADIAGKYGFTDIQYKLYRRTRSFTAKEYTALLGTYSDHIALEENTRKRFFSEIEAAIDDHGGQITLYDTMDLELARKKVI